MDTTFPIFRSAEQARLLTKLYLNPERWWQVRQLADGDTSEDTVSRELTRLATAGLISLSRTGNVRQFRPDPDSPLHGVITALVEKTMGVEEGLRSRLSAMPGVEAAAIFGSWARGAAAAASDVDVLVIGDPDYEAVVQAVTEVGAQAGREINVVNLTEAEFRERIREGDGFITHVLESPLLALIGVVAVPAGARA